MNESEIRNVIRKLLSEDSAADILFDKEGKRIYKLIVKKIDTISFEPTNENDFSSTHMHKFQQQRKYACHITLENIDN